MKKNKEIITALKKADSHLKNVIKMVEKNEYCVDILQQNLAVMGLLKSANNKLMEGHLNTCFIEAIKGSNKRQAQKMINELLQINKKVQ